MDTVPSGTQDLTLTKAAEAHSRWVVNLWFPFAAFKFATDKNWHWRVFPWDRIIASAHYQTVAAVDPVGWVQGLMAYRVLPDRVKIDFIATAPWNYGANKSRKGVGTALLSNAIQFSATAGHAGALILSSVPEAEAFYDGRRFKRTGERDAENLAIFEMPRGRPATAFLQEYPAIRIGDRI